MEHSITPGYQQFVTRRTQGCQKGLKSNRWQCQKSISKSNTRRRKTTCLQKTRCLHNSEYTLKCSRCHTRTENTLLPIAIAQKERTLYHTRPYGVSKMGIWIQLALVCSVAVLANSQNFQFAIEPSHRLVDAEDDAAVKNMNQEQYTRPPYIGETDLFRRKNLRFLAVEGHLFNRSLVEEVKKFDPNLLSEGDRVQVHFSSAFEAGGRWLIFRESSNLLQGVPLPVHEGTHNLYILIRHKNSPSQSTTTLPCTVEVLAEQQAFEMRQVQASNPEVARLEAAYRCPHLEPVTAAAIVVHADVSVISEAERVQCVQALAAAIGAPSASISMRTEGAAKNDRPFMSGPGNIPKAPLTPADDNSPRSMVLSWPLGCSSDLNDAIPGLERLEKAAKDGSLAQATGYDIFEWKIVNRVHRFRKLTRLKRQAGQDVPASANLFYPRAKRLPLTGGENFKAMPSLETEETVGTMLRGRTRVNLAFVRATPMPGMPVRASKLPVSLDRNIIPPSTPTIPKPVASKQPESVPLNTNHPPMVLFSMADVKSVLGVYMEFRIPEDAFYDQEDRTRDLHLKVLDSETKEPIPNQGSWPLFDPEAQLLYGVPTSDAKDEKKYILYAEDSGGKSCTFTFMIYVEKVKPKPDTHKFTFFFTETKETKKMTPDAIFTSFGRKLAVALAKTDNMPGDLAMLKTDTAKGGEQRYVSWFYSSLNSDECGGELRTKIKGAGVLIAGEDAHEGRNKPTKEFSAKFKPEYKLKYVKIDLIGSCTSPSSTTETPTMKTDPPPTPAPSTPTPATPMPSTPAEPEIHTVLTTQPTTTTSTTTTTTTTTSTTTISTESPAWNSMPMAVKPLPQLGVRTGRFLEFSLPIGTFEDRDDPGTQLKIAMAGPTPSWVGFELETRTVYAVPTSVDFDALEAYNSTHRMWKGSLTAADKDGLVSPPLELKIFVQGETVDVAKKANHLFQFTIKNYVIKNFTASDRLRIIRLVADIFGDDDASAIYVEPLKAGSVIFSWHNVTLAFLDPCPYEDIASLASKLFSRESVKDDVKERFAKENFIVNTFNVSRRAWCVPQKPAPKATPPDEPTTSTAVIATASSKSTSILIIAVVIVCLVLLIVILVVKCRLGKTAREKKRAQKEKQQREEKAMMITSPDNSASPRIKKGVPIIFQEEIGMESNGNAYTSAADPLMGTTTPTHRGNGDSRSPAVAVDDENIREETPFTHAPSHHPMTPPTPILSDRPPPPYVTPH